MTPSQSRGSRRAPRWLVEATAWAAAAVLAAGVAVVALDVVEPPVAEAAPVVAPVPTPTAKPVPAPVKKRAVKVAPPKKRAASAPLPQLGPPPGPQFDPKPTRFAAPEDRYALLAGVTNYRSPTKDTIGSVNDVRYISTYLQSQGWPRENIRLLTDGQVTGKALRDGMRWLASKSEAGKTFTFFHYSGHVKQFGGQRDALWPIDRDWVRDTEVTQLLGQVRGKAWFDIAGCEAGSFQAGLPTKDRLFSASSNAVQKSYEYPPWGMSVWTGLLFDLSMRQGNADADRNKVVTIGEALRYSTYYAQSITLGQRPYGRQTPQSAGDGVRGWTLANPPA